MADKILRVCLSSELPDILDRNSNYIYLTYDKMILYFGQNEFYDNFVIADVFPESPVVGMVYILTTDGSVHRYIDYQDKKIADIEDPSQIDLLKKIGTSYTVNANRRYFDSQQRTLTLPFNNGVYELAVSMRNDQVFDNDTIMKYNENSERFEIYGPHSEEFIDFSKPFRGGTTSTVDMKVDKSRLQGNVRISKLTDNMLRSTSDGIYAKTNTKVEKDTFDEFVSEVSEFKKYATDVLSSVTGEIIAIEGIISDEAINSKIHSQLQEKFSTIEKALNDYADIASSLDKIEMDLLNYASNQIHNSKQEILDKIVWDDLDDSAETYEPEVDYYEKSEEYLTPPDDPPIHIITEEELLTIISTAVQLYIEAEELEGGNEMRTFGVTLNGIEYIVQVREIIDPEPEPEPEPNPEDPGTDVEPELPPEDGEDEGVEEEEDPVITPDEDDVADDETNTEETDEESVESDDEVDSPESEQV